VGVWAAACSAASASGVKTTCWKGRYGMSRIVARQGLGLA
jgi:hypothetical protein